MKKLVLLFAAAAMAVSVSAQTVTESKTFDNFYIGVNGGVMTKTTNHSWLNNLNSNAGLRIGRWFTQYSVWLLRAMFTSTITTHIHQRLKFVI